MWSVLISLLLLISSVFGQLRPKRAARRARRRNATLTPPPTMEPTTSEPTPLPTPSNDELCACYTIDTICDPFPNNDGDICYYYKIEKVSDNIYCAPIEYISLGTGDLYQCGLQLSDIDLLVTEYAPKSYNIDAGYDGTCNGTQVGVPGIKLQIAQPPQQPPPPDYQSGSQPPPPDYQSGSQPPPPSGTGSGTYPAGSPPPPPSGTGSGSYPAGQPPPPPPSGTGSGTYPSGSPPPPPGSDPNSYTSGSGAPPPGPPKGDEYMVFSICFDSVQVAGFQASGSIGMKTGYDKYTCDAVNVLPNFCG